MLGWGFIGSARVVTQARFCPSLSPGTFGLPWESLRLRTQDRVPIDAWLLRHPRAEGILLMLHGYSASKADLLDVARSFFEAGRYHLLLIDFRAHGGSGGRRISFGKQEVLEIQAALEFFKGIPEFASLPIGCYGISMGGAIAILAAARFAQLQAVVTDSAYADLARALAASQWLKYRIPRFPLGQAVIWGTQLRLRTRLKELSPLRVVARIAPRPILFIHGEADLAIPAEGAKALFAAAAEPKQLWLVPGAQHADAFYRQPQVYTQRVLEFFDRGFRRAA